MSDIRYLIALDSDIQNKELIRYVIDEIAQNIIRNIDELKQYMTVVNCEEYIDNIRDDIIAGKIKYEDIKFTHMTKTLKFVNLAYEKAKETLEKGYILLEIDTQADSLEDKIIKYLNENKEIKIIK